LQWRKWYWNLSSSKCVTPWTIKLTRLSYVWLLRTNVWFSWKSLHFPTACWLDTLWRKSLLSKHKSKLKPK
jgi:hypothetical protein